MPLTLPGRADEMMKTTDFSILRPQRKIPLFNLLTFEPAVGHSRYWTKDISTKDTSTKVTSSTKDTWTKSGFLQAFLAVERMASLLRWSSMPNSFGGHYEKFFVDPWVCRLAKTG